MATKKKSGKLKIRWVVSFIGCPRSMRQTIRGMGFRRMNQLVELDDTPSTRGMIARVHHLVKIEDAKEDAREETKKDKTAA